MGNTGPDAILFTNFIRPKLLLKNQLILWN